MNRIRIFKTSKSNSNLKNLIKTGFYSSIFWFIFLYLIPNAIHKYEQSLEFEFPSSRMLGIISFIIFSGLNIWSGISMSLYGKGTPLPIDCPNRIVIKGPYMYVRNPMAIGGIGQGISVGIYLGSILTILFSLLGAIVWHFFVRPKEELDLAHRFGKDYLNYKKHIRNWWPTFNKENLKNENSDLL